MLTKADKRAKRREFNEKFERYKPTHEWISDIKNVGNAYVPKVYRENIRCKRCGMSYFAFKANPMSCEETVINDIIK